jgi:hypothetical protein
MNTDASWSNAWFLTKTGDSGRPIRRQIVGSRLAPIAG